MILFDYMTMDPWDELQSGLQRVSSDEFSKGSSLKGRAICVWKVGYHTVALILKPPLYIAAGVTLIAIEVLFKAMPGNPNQMRMSVIHLGKNLILVGLVAPVGQIAQIVKAVLGIFHPGCYFKEDELSIYFNQLTEMAEELECEPELIEMLSNGASLLTTALQTGGSRIHYQALYKRDLDLICEKLNDPALSQDEKLAILKMFSRLSTDQPETGFYSCAPGIGRLLEQICGCLDIPKDPEKIIPWLVAQMQEEILQQIVMQIEPTHKYKQFASGPDFPAKESKGDLHFSNYLILALGEKIGLPQETIEKAALDLVAKAISLPEDEKQELLDWFNELYTEEALKTYLMSRINSQPDGSAGLKDFRNYLIEKLAEQVSEKEIEASKQEVQDRFEVSEILADEPIFYVKLHYFLEPDSDPSDEKSSDLNGEAILAFTATLENDPFAYFQDHKIIEKEIE